MDTADPDRLPNDPAVRAAENDGDAGFVVTGNFERFNQRNDAFCRSVWDDSLAALKADAFYHSYLMEKAQPRKGAGFHQRDFALRNASWAVANDYSSRNIDRAGIREGFLDPLEPSDPGPGPDQQAEISSPDAQAREIKHIARMFGADLVGITAFDPRWSYAARADIHTMEEKPNDLPDGLTSVIVMAHAMDYDVIRTYPSALGGAGVGLGYSKEASTVVMVSQYIRNLGYTAVASMNDTALVIPYAIKAGLGEYGRNQVVITPQYGPRVRFSKIFTNIPLAHDAPRLHGVRQTCDICTRCADACPPKALPHGEPTEFGPNQSNIRGVMKWSADCEKCFGYWAKLKTDCAICLRACPYNQDRRTWRGRLVLRLLRGRLRKLGLWLSDRWKSGARISPEDWWQKAAR